MIPHCLSIPFSPFYYASILSLKQFLQQSSFVNIENALFEMQ